ncbi:MAG: HupE/UreJ family protein [Gammaproteobacteria bacterium]|nr:HupE/UreJ family protein [Gammaproteobacteria bacterium]
MKFIAWLSPGGNCVLISTGTELKPVRGKLKLAAVVAAIFFAVAAHGHPEDEFCTPGEDGLDPALCAALAELNNSEADVNQAELKPLLDATGMERSFWSTAALYVTIGVGHILPDGTDHILFVLAIFLASTRLRALVIQISAFTVAHTATLALAATGVITPSASVVEPLIALTIAFVAIENLVFKEMTSWRPVVVFGFGLIHGLGFAGFFGELGLPPGQFWSALIGFNVGVEIGQLTVIVAAALLGTMLRRALRDPTGVANYRRYLVRPGSLLIGLTGLWWAILRFSL